MPQFFVSKGALRSGTFLLDPSESSHAGSSRRLKPLDLLQLFDGEGGRYLARFERWVGNKIQGRLLNSLEAPRPARPIRLYWGLGKAKKWEFVLEAGCELGAQAFIPVLMERSIRRPEAASFNQKKKRWDSLLLQACKRCNRAERPALEDLQSLPEALHRAQMGGVLLAAWEKETRTSWRALLPKDVSTPIHLFIGPEGGFSDAEIGRIRAAGGRTFSLGPYNLRTELAALVAMALLLHTHA